MTATNHDSRTPTVNVLNGLLLTVGVVTIGAGLYLAATDRVLLTAAVCLAGLIPAGALAYAISLHQPRPTGAKLIERQRRSGFAIFAVGVAAVVIGGVLLFTMPSPLGTILLWTGPGLVLGGIAVIAFTRAKKAKDEQSA